jgi:nucleoside-diphosphate-sugar epimerase
MKMATVLFAGFGDLGRTAGEHLAQSGMRVIALKRTPPAVAIAGVEYHCVDLRQPFTLPPALRAQADAVVIAVSPQQRTPEDYAATYIGAVEHTLRAVRAAGAQPRCVLFISSTAVYPEAPGSWFTEDVAARPDSWNGEILLRAEQAAIDSGLPATALRLAGIYGPDRLMLVRRAEAIIAGRDSLPVPAWTNRIHRDDAARLIAFLVNQAMAGTVLDRIYNGVDNEPSLNVDVLGHIITRLRGNPDLDFDAKVTPVQTGVGGKRVGNARIRALGFQFAYPDFRSGYAAVLAGYSPAGAAP